jgi:NAD(P)-dependent dehydrogenase (short-subunit alcohol dehydrogenase family)
VRGLFFVVQKALPLLSHGSSVILNGSIASIKGFEAFSVYDATKAAVRSFARSWIVDLKGRGIRVNVLSPGHIDTPGLSALMTDEQRASALANVPVCRLGTPDDMGKVAVFLASDDSSYVNGIKLFADGGVAQYRAMRAPEHYQYELNLRDIAEVWRRHDPPCLSKFEFQVSR